MSGFGPEPSDDAVERERERWRETHDTRQRVTEVVTGLREPTRVAEIADLAACSANAARKHLADLADLGVVRSEADDRESRYRRNDEYFRWRRANELATEHTIEALSERLAALETRDGVFRDRYDAPAPETVSIHDDAGHKAIHELQEELVDWATARREMIVVKDAIRMAGKEHGGELLA